MKLTLTPDYTPVSYCRCGPRPAFTVCRVCPTATTAMYFHERAEITESIDTECSIAICEEFKTIAAKFLARMHRTSIRLPA